MFVSIVSFLSFFYLFPEIKIFSYSVASFLPFIIFAGLLTQRNFYETLIQEKKLLKIWLIFISINIISLIFSPYKYLALLGTARVISISLLFWILLWFLKENKNWKIFLNFLISLLVFSVLLNLFLFFNPELINKYLQKLYLHPVKYPRLGYPFTHPISFGFFLIIILIIILFGTFSKQLRLILYFFISLGVLLTGGKAAFLFYVFFSCISFFVNKTLKEYIPILVMMIITIIIFSTFWLPIKKNETLSQIVNPLSMEEKSPPVEHLYTIETYKEASVSKRIEIWKEALFYISQRPLVGYGALVQRYELTKILAHNIYLDVLLSYGLLGFFFLLYLIYKIAQRVIKIPKPLYTYFFLYFFLNTFIETMFFGGIVDMIFFAFLIKLKNEKVLNNNNYS